MNPSFNAEIESFCQQVRDFISANLPAETRNKVAQEQMDLPREDQQDWHRQLYRSGGWGCPSWSEEHGGPGWSDQQQYVFERELALNDAPRLLIYGAAMLGPTLMEFGTEEQKQRFLPSILNGDVMWCQGYSEPAAGSDLAALQCRAERDGADYIINGSKLWTSEAHIADWLFGLFRTDNSGKKQFGITFLLIDLKSPGITIHPMLLFEGTHEVNQVFFDNVRVPVTQRIGEEHQGWTIAKYLLGLERFGTAEISRSLASLERLKHLVETIGLTQDTCFCEKLASVELELQALEITEQRFLFGPGGPDALGPEASMLKICGTEIQQRILELTMEAMAYYAYLQPGALANQCSNPIAKSHNTECASRNYFNYRKTSIYSGSNEIQKNIIAKAVLGL